MPFRLNLFNYYFIHLLFPVKKWSVILYKKDNKIYKEVISPNHKAAVKIGRIMSIFGVLGFVCTSVEGYLYGLITVLILMPLWYFRATFDEVENKGENNNS